MVNLRISIVNPPVGAQFWSFNGWEGMRFTPGARNPHSGALGLEQPAEFALPGDWTFPTGFHLGVADNVPQWIFVVQTNSPGEPGYNPNIYIPGPGDYILDCATGLFYIAPVIQPPVVQPPEAIPGMEGIMNIFMLVIMMELMAGIM